MSRTAQFKKGDRALYIRFHRGLKVTVVVRLVSWNRRTTRWVVQSIRGGHLEAAECELEKGTLLDHLVWETKS